MRAQFNGIGAAALDTFGALQASAATRRTSGFDVASRTRSAVDPVSMVGFLPEGMLAGRIIDDGGGTNKLLLREGDANPSSSLVWADEVFTLSYDTGVDLVTGSFTDFPDYGGPAAPAGRDPGSRDGRSPPARPIQVSLRRRPRRGSCR